MPENRKKYYEYLKSSGADVPPTYESFSSTLQDSGSAKQYYEYLKKEGFDAPDTFESFSSTMEIPVDVKKKATPLSQQTTIAKATPKGSGVSILEGGISGLAGGVLEQKNQVNEEVVPVKQEGEYAFDWGSVKAQGEQKPLKQLTPVTTQLEAPAVLGVTFNNAAGLKTIL